MLTITPAAEEALEAVLAGAEDVPEGTGVRISQSAGPDGQPALGLAFAPEPEAGDQVVEEASVPVFVAPEVAGALDDKVLDAQLEGNQVAFELGEQG